MAPRLDLTASPAAAKSTKHFYAASRAILDSTLPQTIQHLAMLRASQINGCGFCTDVHTKEALAAGESALRVSLVVAWRETSVFTEAERAALELTEQGTRVADAAGGVGDEVWQDAAAHFDADQLAALVVLIGLINASNRMCIITRMEGGAYTAGQFE